MFQIFKEDFLIHEVKKKEGKSLKYTLLKNVCWQIGLGSPNYLIKKTNKHIYRKKQNNKTNRKKNK